MFSIGERLGSDIRGPFQRGEFERLYDSSLLPAVAAQRL